MLSAFENDCGENPQKHDYTLFIISVCLDYSTSREPRKSIASQHERHKRLTFESLSEKVDLRKPLKAKTKKKQFWLCTFILTSFGV